MMETWTIYDHPSDYPDKYVARKFKGEDPTQDYVTHSEVSVIRQWLESEGLVCLTRHESDDACIMETWI